MREDRALGVEEIVVDGRRVKLSSATKTEALLVELLREGLHPTGGGCLCMAGDCSHCLATVDGTSYVRTCQVQATPGMVVERCHLAGNRPRLIRDEEPLAPHASSAQHRWCDVAVIGQGASGRRESARLRERGLDVVTLDAGAGQEVAGIYAGPTVVARTTDATITVHARDEVVVATGAAEIQPVVPGSELSGLMTARACSVLHQAGLDLGQVVAIGVRPTGVDARLLEGRLLRCEGTLSVSAVVMVDDEGTETRYPCDTVSFGLGLHPRDALVRMGHDLPVRAIGECALPSDIPAPPIEGTVCACSNVLVSDLDFVWNNGFRELELVKRATLAGTGTCQGSACLPHIRSFLEARGKELQPPFTARPLTRQLTFQEIAAGAHHHATPRTPLHEEHLALGAHMQRSGGWWRPWDYGDVAGERAAVREAVSLGDVSTLGKFLVQGPDALAFLELVYPTYVASLKDGGSRYALLLDERGYVLDDGLICREHAERFYLTLTSAGSTLGELWLRDWAESRKFDVAILNQTQSLAAINVTGPRAAELMVRAGARALPGFARHGAADVAGVECRVLRLSFTGELSYELHHAAADSVRLWRTLLELGRDLGIRPHGLDALMRLRLEKGHIVVGQDTDFDSTPRRIAHEWAVKLEKTEFVGKSAVERTNRQPLDRELVGLEMELPAPLEGVPVWHDERYLGYVTSSTDSAVLGKAVMLAWVDLVNGEVPQQVTIGGRDTRRPARRTSLPFFDPAGERARTKVSVQDLRSQLDPSAEVDSVECESDIVGRFRRLEATRLVGPEDLVTAAIERSGLSAETLSLRVAPDEALVTADVAAVLQALPPEVTQQLIAERETGFAAAWLNEAQSLDLLARGCAWELPSERPAFAQGAAWEIPVKLWFERARVLFMVPAPYAEDLDQRMSACALSDADGATR